MLIVKYSSRLLILASGPVADGGVGVSAGAGAGCVGAGADVDDNDEDRCLAQSGEGARVPIPAGN